MKISPLLCLCHAPCLFTEAYSGGIHVVRRNIVVESGICLYLLLGLPCLLFGIELRCVSLSISVFVLSFYCHRLSAGTTGRGYTSASGRNYRLEYETWAATQNGDASARVLGDRLKPYHIVECTLFLGPGTDRDVLSRRFRAALSLCAAQALGGKRPTIPRTAFTRVLCQSV